MLEISGDPKAYRVTKEYPQLRGIMKLGDRVEVIPILYGRDFEVNPGKTKWDEELRKRVQVIPPTIAKKGSYKGFKIRAKNKIVYTDMSIINQIGNIPLSDFLTEVKPYKKTP